MSIDNSIVPQIEDINGNIITNLNADFTTKTYSLAKMHMLLIELKWDNTSLLGDLFLDYSTGTNFINYNHINVDGTFSDAGWVDSNIGALAFRVRYVHSSGSANITSFSANLKGDK